MGDRGNIAVQENGKRVWFYTHWSGWNMPALVHKAIAKRERWDDPPYLARIVFCALVAGHVDGTTGFGISTEPSDNEYSRPYLIVDCDQQTIRLEPNNIDEYPGSIKDPAGKAFTFETYASLPSVSWRDFGIDHGE